MFKALEFGEGVSVYAWGGVTIEGMLQKLRDWRVHRGVRSVTVLVGTNNIGRGMPIPMIVHHYYDLIRRVQYLFPGALVNCLNILPRADIDAAAGIVRANCLLWDMVRNDLVGVNWVNCLGEFLDYCGCHVNLRLLGRGRLHPNPQGKQLLTGIINTIICKA